MTTTRTRFKASPVPAEPVATVRRGRPPTPVLDKALKQLRADLARNEAEYAKIAHFDAFLWGDAHADYLNVISRLKAAIAKLEADGLPDGFDAKAAGLS